MKVQKFRMFVLVGGLILRTLGVLSGIPGKAQNIPPYDPPKVYTPTKMTLYTSWVGLWRTDHTFESSIRLSNQLAISSIDATVTLFMADGTPYMLPPVHLNKSGVETVSINTALASAPAEVASHLSDYGSASVSYRYDWQGVVYASVSILDIPRSLQYTYPFMFPMNNGMSMNSGVSGMTGTKASSTVMEGLFWSYSKDSVSFLAFANTSSREVHVSLATLGREGRQVGIESFSVPAMNTAMRLVSNERDRDETEDADKTGRSLGGVRIAFDADADALSIVGGIEDAAHGYSASLPLAQAPTNTATSGATFSAASAGLMVGAQDPMMGFPTALRFYTYAYFRNIGDTTLKVSAAVHYGETQPESLALPDLVIPAHASRRLKFPALVEALNGAVTLSFSYSGEANSLLVATGAVDETGNYVFAVEPRASGKSVSKSSVYWSMANGFDTMYSVWNPTDKAQDVLLKLSYGAGGSYIYPVHIEPRATAMADIKQIAMMGMADANGNTLPLTAGQGSLVLTAANGNDADPIDVVFSGGIYNPATATCGNTCETCNGCTSFSGNLNPYSLGLPVTTYGWFYCQCPWYNGSMQSLSNYSSWNSNNTGVATVQNSPNYGLSYGAGAGSATISAQIAQAPANAGQICTQGTLPQCPTGSPTQSGGATVVGLQVLYNTSPVAQNSTVLITTAPGLPLSSYLIPGSLNGTVNWGLSIVYNAPGTYNYGCSITSSGAAASIWNIGVNFSSLCGGSAVLTYQYNGLAASFPFTVLGQNPSVSAVKAQLGTTPWYIQQLANSESNYSQFNSSGYPVFGAPNGYGIMQIDYGATTQDLWNWMVNIGDGQNVLAADIKAAGAWWNNQVTAWQAYNAAHPQATIPAVYNATEGPCEFSMNPSGSMHPYWDALAMKAYNSGGPNASTAYIQFTGSSGWLFRATNSSGFDYVYRVCTTNP